MLESQFRRHRYISPSERSDLVAKTGMTARQITVWVRIKLLLSLNDTLLIFLVVPKSSQSYWYEWPEEKEK